MMRRRSLVMALVLVLCTTTSAVAVGAPAWAASCTSSSANIYDPNTRKTFTTKWTCPNDRGALMYGDANRVTPTAYMDSTTSWFLCWRRGALHEGGNDVWYYSQGDRPYPGQSQRGNWGYMPAVNVWTSTDPWPGMAQCDEGFSPPGRSDGQSRVLMIHGYSNVGRNNCDSTWGTDTGGTAKNFYRSIGYQNYQLIGVKYYAGDYPGCNVDIGGGFTDQTPIEVIGNRLAWFIYENYSRYGHNVDIVAHSMGGLIARVAISGTQNPNSAPFNNSPYGFTWPPYLYVQDVSTLSAPLEGGMWTTFPGCVLDYNDIQCTELNGNSSFMTNWIKPWGNPQAYVMSGRGGTDWTLIGAQTDGLVDPGSALEFHSAATIGHKIYYLWANPELDHSSMPGASTTAQYKHFYCDYYNPCTQRPSYCLGCYVTDGISYSYNFANWNYNGAAKSPIEVAAWGNYYASGR